MPGRPRIGGHWRNRRHCRRIESRQRGRRNHFSRPRPLGRGRELSLLHGHKPRQRRLL
jgi:hypothetical protein